MKNTTRLTATFLIGMAISLTFFFAGVFTNEMSLVLAGVAFFLPSIVVGIFLDGVENRNRTLYIRGY
ncbi:MAG: hypothetical protein H9W81_07640 [Enterococcus sp.]|nr:hypothetical protein [Enterococcus sp.]